MGGTVKDTTGERMLNVNRFTCVTFFTNNKGNLHKNDNMKKTDKCLENKLTY